MTDDDKALDKIIRASMPLDFERKETLSGDKSLVARLRSGCLPMKHDAADRIEAQAAELVRIKERLGWRIEAQAAEIERLREALMKISLRKWNSMTQGCNAAREANDIARAALEARND